MKRHFFIFLVFTSSIASGQVYSILGTVFEGENNTPLHNATVFIDNTTLNVRTGPDGTFMIKGLPALHYNLVVYAPGYGPQMVDVLPGEPLAYKVILKPLEKIGTPANPVQEFSRIQKLNNYDMFKDHFVGLSENSRQCAIENPESLSVNLNGDTLTVTADTAVWIENRGLGYSIKVLIENFVLDTTSMRTDYIGHPYYERLTPKDDKEAKRWASNRIKAYNGSLMHFFRAFYNRNLNDQGFYFNIFMEYNVGLLGGGLERSTQSDSVKTAPSPVYNNRPIKMATITDYSLVIDSLSLPGEPMLDFVGNLEVTYIMEEEGYLYQKMRAIRNQRKPQRSELVLHRPAIIQPNGEVYPWDAIETRGYWTWELMSERLPLDYDPGDDLKLLK